VIAAPCILLQFEEFEVLFISNFPIEFKHLSNPFSPRFPTQHSQDVTTADLTNDTTATTTTTDDTNDKKIINQDRVDVIAQPEQIQTRQGQGLQGGGRGSHSDA